MELRQLRYFLTVLQCGSLNKAAQALNVTQPSLSHSIKALERSVGAELLIRGGGGVRPTEIGTTFERYARNIIREAEKAKSEVALMRGAGKGKLAIGALSVFVPRFIPNVLSTFLDINPDIEIEAFTFTYNAPDVVMNDILSSTWDVALTLLADGIEASPQIALTHIGDYPSRVYCAPHHPFAGKKNVGAEALAAADWVVTNTASAQRLLQQCFEGCDQSPHVRMRVNSLEFATAMAKQHPLLCMAPIEAVAHDIEHGDLVEVDQTVVMPSSRIVLLHSNLSERTEAMRQFMAACVDYAETLKRRV